MIWVSNPTNFHKMQYFILNSCVLNHTNCNYIFVLFKLSKSSTILLDNKFSSTTESKPHECKYSRLQVLKAEPMETQVFYDMMPCPLANTYGDFRTTNSTRIQ